MKTLCAVFAFVTFLAAPVAFGAEATVTTLVPPEPIDISAPIFPQDAAGNEAWVQISFTVKADGTTADVAVTDGFYSEAFKAVTLAAAKGWKFKPATENGKPTDWSNYTFNIPFAYLDTQGGAYPSVSKRYEEIAGLLRAKQFGNAKTEIDDTISKGIIRLLYEYAIIQTTLYSAENGLGHNEAAYFAIKRATPEIAIARRGTAVELGSRIDKRAQIAQTALLTDDVLKIALRDRFIAEAKLGLYLDALSTFDRIAKLEQIQPTDPINGQVKVIRDALASDQPLGIAGQIENGSWINHPVRRQFSFVNVKGTIESIRVVCARHGAVVPYQQDKDWTLPASWGDCDLTVNGSEGTQFVFAQMGDHITSRTAPTVPFTVSPPERLTTMPQPMLPNGAPSPY